MERYCTITSQSHAVLTLALHESLVQAGERFELSVLCFDDSSCETLSQLELSHTELITHHQLVGSQLREVLRGRSSRSASWTLKPYLLKHLLRQVPEGARCTYLDTDLFFFSAPSRLYQGFDEGSLLLTEHGYAPQYRFKQAMYGRFCAQFVAVRNDPAGRHFLNWWQERCTEACPEQPQGGLHGDQMYLDFYESCFPERVRRVQDPSLARGPWNEELFGSEQVPAFYHFQGLQFINSSWILSGIHWRRSTGCRNLYQAYYQSLRRQRRNWLSHGGVIGWLWPRGLWPWTVLRLWLTGQLHWQWL